jgi:hypothetical protein
MTFGDEGMATVAGAVQVAWWNTGDTNVMGVSAWAGDAVTVRTAAATVAVSAARVRIMLCLLPGG